MTSIVPDLADAYEVWFLTGSQDLYGEETLRQVAEQSQQVAAQLGEAADVPVRIVWKPVLKDSDAIRRAVLEANADDAVIGVIAWMHTFSPAKMWIAGLDALQKPLLHLHTQANVELPWGEIDFDFMNLNQAAHGDREFGYIQTRLGVAAQDGRRARLRPARAARRSAPGTRAAAGRAASAVAEARPVRRQHALRRRHRGRQDRGRAAVRRAGQHLGRQRARRRGARGDRRRRRRARRRVPRPLRRRRPSCDAAATGTSRCATAPRIELGLRSFLEAGGFGAFTTSFEDLGALRQLPGLAVQRLMADGYGFGAEGDWKTAVLVRVADRHGRRPARRREPDGGLHLPPRARQRAHPRRAHARGQSRR